MMTQQTAAMIWALGLVAWFAIRLPYQRRARRIRVVAARSGQTERLALLAALVGLLFIPAIYLASGFPAFADYRFRPFVGWCGLIVEILFLALFLASHRQLGANWSVTLEIRRDHRLIKDGLYRYVRHPMYSSFWLWGIAQVLLLPNWVAGVSGIVGVGVLFFLRVGQEEALMYEVFGDEYRSYAATTGRVFPRIF